MLGLGQSIFNIGVLIRGIVRKNLQLWLDFEKSEVIGSELVVNGGFDTDTDWVKGTGWTIANDIATCDGSQITDSGFYQLGVFISGGNYTLTFDITSNGEPFKFWVNGSQNIFSEVFTDGTKTFNFTATTSGSAYFEATSNFIGTLDNISVKEISQFAKDKSPNTNNAKLFTGKALSFGGNDWVDCGNDSALNLTDNFTLVTTVKLSASQTVKGIVTRSAGTDDGYGLSIDSNGKFSFPRYTSSSAKADIAAVVGEVYRVVSVQDNGVNKLYINGVLQSTTGSQVVTSTTENFALGRLYGAVSNFYLSGDLADIQIYNAAWQQSDVTFDYNNPNHLVTDNPNSTIALSNLKGYWALSEGQGGYAYNSAVALGSEEVANGTFDTDLSGWNITDPSGVTVEREAGRLHIVTDGTGGGASQSALTIGKTYHIVFDYEAISGSLKLDAIISPLNTTKTYSIIYTATQAPLTFYRLSGAAEGYVDNVTVKEVSVGEINGATYVDAQPTIPQLGMMDWAKSTIGSDEITLIQDPNNKGFDILGNALRLREHGFNLDGSGYAEVADDDSLDFGTGDFTIETWLKIGEANTERILDKRDATSGYTLYRTASNVLKLELNDGTGNSGYTISAAQSSGVWLHIIVVGIRSGNATCYINTDAETPVDISLKSGSLDSASPLIIGADAPNGDSLYSTDIIDEVLLYPRALTFKEIKQNFKSGINKHKATSSFSDDFSSDYGL